jgi:hypothetical protein
MDRLSAGGSPVAPVPADASRTLEELFSDEAGDGEGGEEGVAVPTPGTASHDDLCTCGICLVISQDRASSCNVAVNSWGLLLKCSITRQVGIATYVS